MKNRNDLTRERVLDEAETLFAQKGYHAVSVREITTAAECNLAAVNYHFGNKQNLYLEVFRERWFPRDGRERISPARHGRQEREPSEAPAPGQRRRRQDHKAIPD